MIENFRGFFKICAKFLIDDLDHDREFIYDSEYEFIYQAAIIHEN